MATVPRGEINGLIDTGKTVWSNMQELARASAAWITNDIESNKWSVIINRPGTASMHFDDDNIISNVDVSMSSIKDMYNRVVVTFPNKELHDEYDHIDMRIPVEDMYPGETENTLNIRLEVVNDQIQAKSIAGRELKQSRVDQVVEFATDYRASGVKAGAIISISSNVYDWDHKLWRVMRVEEHDADDGTITINITAFEYDESVYNLDGLEVVTRTVKTGIVPRSMNTGISDSDGTALANGMDYSQLMNLINLLLSNQFGAGSGFVVQNVRQWFMSNAYLMSRFTAGQPLILTLDTLDLTDTGNLTSFDVVDGIITTNAGKELGGLPPAGVPTYPALFIESYRGTPATITALPDANGTYAGPTQNYTYMESLGFQYRGMAVMGGLNTPGFSKSMITAGFTYCFMLYLIPFNTVDGPKPYTVNQLNNYFGTTYSLLVTRMGSATSTDIT